MSKVQEHHSLMKFDPATGDEKPYPSHAAQWRDWHGHATAWLFNPYTGIRRDARDVGSDMRGYLIYPANEPMIITASYETALSAEDDFWQTWESAIDLKPYLSIEIGYTRPTDWMVHIWNSEGVGLAKAPKIIMTQNTSRAEAMMEAAKQLRALFNLTA